MKVDFFRHNIDETDIERVGRVLRSRFLSTGLEVAEFENRFAAYLGLSRCVGLSSCTAALHLCLLAWGIGPGHEVITTPMTFCATANAVIHAGAVPVFGDVEPLTGNLDADRIESRITEHTRAILPVHLYGKMCDMRKIRAVADRHNLVVIEDAAHCVEGLRDGVRPGGLGDAACFSFYATKSITSGEGGAVATNNSEKALLIERMRLHGIDITAIGRYTGPYQHWDMPLLGWKYNMDNIQAALLIGQLSRIDSLWERRAYISERYDQAFEGLEGVRVLPKAKGGRSALHLYTIRVPGEKRDAFLAELQQRGVGVAVNYRPVHLLGYYRERFGHAPGEFPEAEAIGAETISLPIYPSLSDIEIIQVIGAVRETAGFMLKAK